jgi:hypothetical protein
MRKFALIAFLAAHLGASAQVNNVYRTAGISYTIGAPTYRPGAGGSLVAIDTVSGIWYISRDRNSVNWLNMGQRIEKISGCSAPLFTPNKMNSAIVINSCSPPDMYYHTGGGTWECITCGGGGGGGTVSSDATIDGDGSGGSPLKIAQQSAVTPKVLSWTGTTWEPSWGNPYTFVTSGSTITTAVNEVLIGTLAANITIGLPSCNSTNDTKHFKFIRNGSDAFSVTIDPSSTEAFYDGATTKIIYGKIAIDCTCRFSGGTGVWFVDNL